MIQAVIFKPLLLLFSWCGNRVGPVTGIETVFNRLAPSQASFARLVNMAAAASAGKGRGYHKVTLGKTVFEVDVRYMNLKPIGRGACVG